MERYRLRESEETDIIKEYKELDEVYQTFCDKCSVLSTVANSNKNISLETEDLYDFVVFTLSKKMLEIEDAILDEYYPIDYADEEDDPDKARERYRESIRKRNAVFGTETRQESWVTESKKSKNKRKNNKKAMGWFTQFNKDPEQSTKIFNHLTDINTESSVNSDTISGGEASAEIG